MTAIVVVKVIALDEFRARLTLSNGQQIERDLSRVIEGGIFEALRRDPELFGQMRVEGGTIVWPIGADICPDVLIWGGPPPSDDSMGAPETLVVPRQPASESPSMRERLAK